MGERDSGWTASFNVLYWPLRAFAHGAYAALPARHEAPVDVVPVDYVADAIFALSQAPETEGSTFHLTAGRDASSVGELVELASEFFGRRPPRLVHPAVYRRVVHPLLTLSTTDERRRRALTRSQQYFPYFAMNLSYDDRRSRVALRGTGTSPSHTTKLLRPLGAVRDCRKLGTHAHPPSRCDTHSVANTPSRTPYAPRVRVRPVPVR